MNLTEIKIKPINELVDIATELGLEDVGRLKKQEIIFRIFKHKGLKSLAVNEGMSYKSFHWAHGIHSPYWWLQCLFWKTRESSYLIKMYHKFLVCDLMKKPLLTRVIEFILQPLIGKSVVMYFRKPLND